MDFKIIYKKFKFIINRKFNFINSKFQMKDSAENVCYNEMFVKIVIVGKLTNLRLKSSRF